jgi:hypothetical protein
MIRITDQSFRYTTSFNTDLRKKFRKMGQERRAAEARKAAETSAGTSVIDMVARRTVPKA